MFILKFTKLLLCFALVSVSGMAQPLQIDNISTTPSTCVDNGSLTVTASGGDNTGAGYTYALVAPSQETRPFQSSNAFSALPSGSYTVEVVDNAGVSVQQIATVGGNYMAPDITQVTITKTSCPGGNDGELTAVYTAGSATPMQFYLYDAAGTTLLQGPQASPTFSGLTDGSYTVRIQDACSIVDNMGAIIPPTVSSSPLSLILQKFELGCTNADVRIEAITSYPPYSYTITDNATGTVVVSNGSASNRDHTLSRGSYTVDVIDACGRTYSKVFDFDNPSIGGRSIQEGCGYKLSISHTSVQFACPNVQYCYKLTSDATWTCMSDSVTATVIPAGNYDVKIINPCCGEEYLAPNQLNIPQSNTSVVQKALTYWCIDNTTARIVDFNGMSNVKVWYVGPALNNFTGTADNNNETFTPGISVGDTMLTQTYSNGIENMRILNLPIGTYTFGYKDDCDPTPKTFDMVISKVDNYNPYAAIELGCPGFNKIHVSKVGSDVIRGNIEILDASGTVIQSFPATSTNFDDTMTVFNLTAGDYTARFYFTGTSSPNYNYLYTPCPQPLDIPLTIPTYSPPDLTESSTYSCAPTMSLVAVGAGVQPMTYAIREVGASAFGPTQSNNVFPGLDPTKVYEVEATDGCSNNAINTVSASGVLAPPNIMAEYDCETNPNGNASTAILSVTNVHGADYEWKDVSSGTVLGTNRTYTLSPVTPGDYQIKVSIPALGSDECVADSATINISTDNCAVILSINNITNFKVQEDNCTALLTWNTETQEKTEDFIVERRYQDEDKFVAVSRIPTSGTANRYYFRDENISNQKGVYYRLAQEKEDGTFEYSSTLLLRPKCSKIESKVSIYPNPVGNKFTVKIKDAQGEYRYTLTNMHGQVIDKGHLVMSANESQPVSIDLADGIYMIEVSNEKGDVENLKLQVRN